MPGICPKALLPYLGACGVTQDPLFICNGGSVPLSQQIFRSLLSDVLSNQGWIIPCITPTASSNICKSGRQYRHRYKDDEETNFTVDELNCIVICSSPFFFGPFSCILGCVIFL